MTVPVHCVEPASHKVAFCFRIVKAWPVVEVPLLGFGGGRSLATARIIAKIRIESRAEKSPDMIGATVAKTRVDDLFSF